MFTLKHRKNGINCLAFSPDGSLLAASGYRGYVQVWDLTAKQLKIEICHGTSDHEAVFFLPRGRVMTLSGQLHTFDLATGKRQPNGFRLGSAMVCRVAAAPWPVPRICAAFWDRRSVYCHALPDGRHLWRGAIDERGGDHETAMAFSGDGRAVAVGLNNGTIYVFDGLDGNRLARIEPAGNPEVKAIALSPRADAIAWCAASHLRLWQLGPTPKEVRHLQMGKTHFLSVAWHPSGEFFATANGDGKVDYWDARTGERRESFDWKVGKLHDVTFDASGDRAACSSKQGDIVVWDVDR